MTPKKPKALPPIAMCKVCEQPIPDAKPSRSKNLTCLACMARGGVDLLTRCHVCNRVLVFGMCENCHTTPERSR